MSAVKLPQNPEDFVIQSIEDRVGGAGFIYFETPNYEGQDVRMGWFGGAYNEEREASEERMHTTERHQPYIFTGNWGEPTFHQIIAAWDAAVKHKLEGFAEYSEQYGEDKIRWMNGHEFVLADRWTLQMIGNKERQKSLARMRKQAKANR